MGGANHVKIVVMDGPTASALVLELLNGRHQIPARHVIAKPRLLREPIDAGPSQSRVSVSARA
jgi:hypothetical protein